MRCRATAAGMTRRSATSTPVDDRPEIIARLIIRQAGVPSREGTTRELGLRGGPSAPARRAAAFPDEALEQMRAGLDLLVGVDSDAGHDHALGSDRDLVADRDALVHAH